MCPKFVQDFVPFVHKTTVLDKKNAKKTRTKGTKETVTPPFKETGKNLGTKD
jgi:hypothetical protein